MMFALSFLPVVLSSQLLSFPVTISPTQGQLVEGDRCVVNKGFGTCLNIRKCAPAIKELRKGNPPTAICGYVGYDQVVCCPSNTESTMSTTERTTTPGKLRGATVARTKCEEYSRAEYQLERSQTLIRNPPLVNISLCQIYPNGYISGGIKADPMEFPHMAAVGFNSANGVVFRCGGSLISERFVLTAAHCLYSIDWGPASWVRVGDLNLERTDDMAEPQEVEVNRRFRHPDYKLPSLYHDVGLLELKSDVTFGAWVRPICLPYSEPDTGNEERATATGWGRTSFGANDLSKDMLKVTINFQDNTRCNQSIRDAHKTPRGIVHDWQICTSEPGKDTCQGDSGGPLVIFNKNYYCMYTIVGITNFGISCGTTAPGVYSRVSNYIPWITETVWPELV